MLLSRRKMLQTLGGVSIAAGANHLLLASVPGLSGRAALLEKAGAPAFPKPDIIRYDAQCFTIHGRDAFIYSACVHYARTPKALWRDRLTKLKQAGFNTIETYVFWNYHEPVEGKVDMTELEDFVALVHEMGFWLIARVGPYACAEWDAGGFPHWIIAKQFPLRSDSPESIRTSQSWYDKVLPIVRVNMITRGGPVILIQIENEYDYWHLPSVQKTAYITALAKMVWNAGIDIPIITNWVKQARDNADPVMAQIMDTCDFYPRWNITKELLPALTALRTQEPMSPIGIAELQGGWFSQFGGLLSVDQEGVGADQLNAVAKTAIENATTFFSFYMGHGGTNFDWAARNLTTSYDYAAPVREPGGLGEKYYAAHLLGSSLENLGTLLVRSRDADGSISSDHPQVSATLRINGASGVLFVRNDSDQRAEFHLKVPPAESGLSLPAIPRQGALTIRSRGMKMLAVQMPFAGGHIRYCTAEILTSGNIGGRNGLLIYDDPGSLVEIALQADKEPLVDGQVEYQHFDAASQTVVIGFLAQLVPKHLLLDKSLQIVVLPSALAGRTWTATLPSGLAPQQSGGTSVQTPIITDCSLLRSAQLSGSGDANFALEYAPGEHDLTILTPVAPGRCTVDGQAVPVAYDPTLQSASIRFKTPPVPFAPVVIEEGDFRVERFEPSMGEWLRTGPVALETIGDIPYGYVKYHCNFDWNGEEQLFLNTFTQQAKKTFLNGRFVPELSSADRSLSVSLAGRARSGSNLLEISYEAFGSANGNLEMQELTGISGIRIGSDQKSVEISNIAVQRVPAAMKGREVNPDYVAQSAQRQKLGSGSGHEEYAPAYVWFNAAFAVPETANWFCPCNITIAADRDALLYVNGRFVGYYRTIGPQSSFYLPETFVSLGIEPRNILTVMLAYTDNLNAIKRLVVSPYMEFAARKTDIAMEWPRS